LHHFQRVARILGVLVVCAACAPAAETPPAEKSEARAVILDTVGNWRLYHTLAPPVVETGEGLKPILALDQKWLQEKTPEPPDDWKTPDFDDHGWLRGPARIACNAPVVRRLCLRGKFVVTDPAKVKDLKVTAGYYGGCIVSVNGTEIARGHLKPGEEGRLGLAESYPEQAYFFGNTQTWQYLTGGPADEMDRVRTRWLKEITVPSRLVRKGLNVLAVEIVRPAEHQCVVRDKAWHRHRTPFDLNWGTCTIRHVQLSAHDAHGLVPNAGRPPGLQVWNSDLLANDFALDFGDTAETLRPVEIVGARNGSFSGKAVVGSEKPLVDFRASVTDLEGPGRIPASAVHIRWAVPWGDEPEAPERYVTAPVLLGALAESPPDEIPVRATDRHWSSAKLPLSPTPVFGAVAPVWVTVDVPRHVKAGDYRGTLTLRAKGVKPLEVPVHLAVEDWTLPDTQDYRTWVELIQSPDTLVEEYKLKPWSREHFEMMAETFRYLNRIGSRILYIPVICRTNIGNEESMVRWIEKPDGTYTWDFSIMDRYLDTATTHMGRPKVVVFWVWEKFMFPTVEDPKTFEQYQPGQRRPARVTDGADPYIGKGPLVTVLDPATGKTDNRHLPYLLDPVSKAIWKPLFETLRLRMKARGLEDTVMVGTPSDIVMRKDQFEFFSDVAPGWRWVNHSHFDVTAIYKAHGARLGYYTTVMNVLFPGYPEDGRHYGWKREELHAHLRSRWGRDYFPLTTWRHVAEVNITGEQRGIGRLGADLWMVVKDRNGRRLGRIFTKYPECGWRSNDLCSSLLAPGPDGPIATVRYEVMREGVQECEARIFIETALTDAKLRAELGDDLAKRAQDTLDERIRFMIKGLSTLNLDGYIAGWSTNATTSWWNSVTIDGHRWYLGSGWQERSRKLYRLAGEVERKLKQGAQ